MHIYMHNAYIYIMPTVPSLTKIKKWFKISCAHGAFPYKDGEVDQRKSYSPLTFHLTLMTGLKAS